MANFYISTAISYPNAPPHLGHAYEAVATDIIARFKRLDGYNTIFATGVDEHGQKIMQTAEKNGLSTAEFVASNTRLFERMLKTFNCSNDDFIRTTQSRHKKAAQHIWQRMAANGDIYLDIYSGWYSVRDEAYYNEDELIKTDDGDYLSPEGTPVEWISEKTYFFRLSKYQQKLLDWYDSHPDFIAPKQRFNEILKFVQGGLRDLSISRTSFDWGIPVPENGLSESSGAKHVMYVWVDALANYLTILGYPDNDSKMSAYWPADVHIIGKDINRFHSVYWPAFLMSAGLDIPKRIFAHGMLLNAGEKMSKSLGNVADPDELVATYGLDAIRYFLVREVPFGNDGSYSRDKIMQRKNYDLANDLGNLAQRCLKMIARNCHGTIPAASQLTPDDLELITKSCRIIEFSRTAIDKQDLYAVITSIWELVGDVNRYFANQQPWQLARDGHEQRMKAVLYLTCELLRRIAIMLQPVIPYGAGQLLDLLCINPNNRNFSDLDYEVRIEAGLKLPEPQAIFPRQKAD